MTKSELAILKALNAADRKVATRNNLRTAAGLTIRGFNIVAQRMQHASLIARAEGLGEMTLTMAGIKALRAAGESVVL